MTTLESEVAEIELGVHTEISNEAYHRGPGISKSGLDLIARSPAHYEHARRHPRPRTPALEMGTAFHTAVLEPHLLDQVAVVGLDLPRRKDVDKRTWAQFEAEHVGKAILKRHEMDHVLAMRDAVRAHPYAGPLLDPVDPGPAEATVYWRDPHTGALCRCRPDKIATTYRQGTILCDLKSALESDVTGASWNSFEKAAANHRYHVSDAMSCEGWREATGETPRYVFVVVEKEPPFGIGIYGLDDDARRRGHELMRRDLDIYAWCAERDEWPCYPPQIRTLSLPRYAFYD